MWTEHQASHHSAREKWKQRRLGELETAKRDLRTRRGAVHELRHQHYSVMFKGALFHEDGESRFEEEHTGIVVALPPVDSRRRDALKEEHCKLYLAVRAEHAKRQRKAKHAEKEAALASQVPTRPGDMAIKGKTPKGQLIYIWSADKTGELKSGPHVFEVMATPRGLRPPLLEGASESAWRQRCRRETTPERALRKMCTKVQQAAVRARRGETERIVATASAAPPSAATCAQPPSLKQQHQPALADREARASMH